MKGYSKKSLMFIMSFLLVQFFVFGQNPDLDKLKKEQVRLEEEIKFTKEQISKIAEKKNHSLSELEALNQQIKARQAIIANYNQQIQLIQNDITDTKSIISSMQKDIELLKKNYAALVYKTYTSQNSYNRMLFVFAAKDFNEAYKRISYLRQFTNFRKTQAELIVKTQANLEKELQKLESNKTEKQNLLHAEWNQKKSLGEEKQALDNKVNTYKSEEQRYIAEIRKKEAARSQLKRQISKLIAEARSKANSNTNSSDFSLTPEARKLSADFSHNKGKLPWPVTHGSIVRSFGKKLHPILRNPPVYENNNGIDIATAKNAPVRAIFNGTVASIFYSPVFQNGIIIAHGNYFSVYTMLDKVDVREGQKVNTKEIIGSAYFDPESNRSEVHLEIWQGQTLLNPSLWISR